MIINMNESKLCTIELIEQFLAGTLEISVTKHDDEASLYQHITRVLKRFDFPRCSKYERGVLLKYLRFTTGYSRAQITRLVKAWHTNRLANIPLAKRYTAPVEPFKRKYTEGDVRLLVEMDRANEDVCGPSIVHLLKRAYEYYGDKRYERISNLSVSHLYNLRKSTGYQRQRTKITKTRPVGIPIGIRKAPSPSGRAGFVRIDSVHQGDFDGEKGVYHITCVDSVSQWQVEACVEGISEVFLMPVLELIMEQLPFVLQGFHSDNGSEYINSRVAKMLEKLRIEQTKSRPRHSNDNGLAESKNNSVVRKHMGYSHIPRRHAEAINQFYQQTFNSWLNLHRPCLYPTDIVSPKGKVVKRYKHADVKTPLECLVLLNGRDLVIFKTDTMLQELILESKQQTDLQAAKQMSLAKSRLFASFTRSRKKS